MWSVMYTLKVVMLRPLYSASLERGGGVFRSKGARQTSWIWGGSEFNRETLGRNLGSFLMSTYDLHKHVCLHLWWTCIFTEKITQYSGDVCAVLLIVSLLHVWLYLHCTLRLHVVEVESLLPIHQHSKRRLFPTRYPAFMRNSVAHLMTASPGK